MRDSENFESEGEFDPSNSGWIYYCPSRTFQKEKKQQITFSCL